VGFLVKQLVPERVLAPLRAVADEELELPGDLLREARRRVSIAALLGALVYVVHLLFGLSGLTNPSAFERTMRFASNQTGFTLCLLVYLLARLDRVSDAIVFRVALAVEVVLCLMISIEAPSVAWERTASVVTLTWAVPIIMLAPLLVPVTPPVVFGVSLLAALTMPLGLLLLDAQGRVEVEAGQFWSSIVTAVVAVGIAVVGSNTVHATGRRLAQARRIGSYQLETLLGRGAMGEVWKARHAFLARPAAVKLIRPEALGGATREARAKAERRFEREAQAMADLRSRHTVELYDFGRSARGVFYYATELLQGINAEHFVHRFGAVPPARAVHWLMQVCDSLGEAHAQGLVHRDIKPSNVLVCRYGRDPDVVKVLDYGLVKDVVAHSAMANAAASGKAAAFDVAPQGQGLGTEGWMAPEQVLGQPADARTDLYGVGCVAYWLITGHKPFEAETRAELARLHLDETPPSLRSHGAHPVSAELEGIVMACLSKEPDERPADADSVALRLRDALNGDVWSRPQAEAWWADEGAVLLNGDEAG
jgi:serine/threonine-protein kinase